MSLLLAAAKLSSFFIPGEVRITSTTNPLIGAITFQRNGDITSVQNSEWYKSGLFNVGDDFEIYAEEIGGPAGFTGTFTTWLPITESRTWALEQTDAGVATGQIRFSIRRIGDTAAAIVQITDFYVEVIV